MLETFFETLQLEVATSTSIEAADEITKLIHLNYRDHTSQRWSANFVKMESFSHWPHPANTCTCSKSTIEALVKSVKCVPSLH